MKPASRLDTQEESRFKMASPVLKWAGGKRKIANRLIQLMPSEFGTYFEPFLGGAAMFLAINRTDAVLGDVNKHLINFYSTLASTPQELSEALEVLKFKYDSLSSSAQKELFYDIRARFNRQNSATDRSMESQDDSLGRAVDFYSLNKLGFNGLYRENSRGEFNVPCGGKKSFPGFDRQNLMDVAARLNISTLVAGDYGSVVENSKEGDFIYFDPPYIPLTPTASFTSYSKAGFGLVEQENLAETMRNLTGRGVKVMMSNSDTELTRRIFSDFHLETIEAPRVISSKSSTRGNVSEIVARNY